KKNSHQHANSTETQRTQSMIDPARHKAYLHNLFSRVLCQNPWYYGPLPAEFIHDILHDEGDFIVHEVAKAGESPLYVISVKSGLKIKRPVVTYKDSRWELKSTKTPFLYQLIDSLVANKRPVYEDGTILRTAIPRADYYCLKNRLIEKGLIGENPLYETYSGKLLCNDGDEVSVAIKKLKVPVTRHSRRCFIRNGNALMKLNLRNLARFYGVLLAEGPFTLLFEPFSTDECLSDHLRSTELSKDTLIRYIKDICTGMYDLHEISVFHGGLSSMCCIFKRSTNSIKISDYGVPFLVVSSGKNGIIDIGKSSIRWMAPEIFTEKEVRLESDVWSFGIVVWEIFSGGQIPFGEMDNAQIKAKIISGQQPLDPPVNAPKLCVQLMRLCLSAKPRDRPSFNLLLKFISGGLGFNECNPTICQAASKMLPADSQITRLFSTEIL
ncbi:Tyrosine-protein kinase transforming protein Fps, partial [Toxocara canis]